MEFGSLGDADDDEYNGVGSLWIYLKYLRDRVKYSLEQNYLAYFVGNYHPRSTRDAQQSNEIQVRASVSTILPSFVHVTHK